MGHSTEVNANANVGVVVPQDGCVQAAHEPLRAQDHPLQERLALQVRLDRRARGGGRRARGEGLLRTRMNNTVMNNNEKKIEKKGDD